MLLQLADDATSFRLADAQRLRDELERTGTSVEIFTNPDTRHGFLDDIRPDLFDAAAAELVWQRTKTPARMAAHPGRRPPPTGPWLLALGSRPP